LDSKKIPWWKWLLAACGVLTLVIGGGLLFSLLRSAGSSGGASEITLHPERQNEILAARRTESLCTRLGLEAEQEAEVSAILQEFMAKRNADREANAGNVFAMMQARRAGMQELDGKLRAVLKPEQIEKLDALKADLFGRMGQLQQLRPLLAPGMPELPLPTQNAPGNPQ